MTVLSDDRQPMFHTIFTADPLPVRRTLGLLRQRFATLTEPDALSRPELVLIEVLDSICTRSIDRANSASTRHSLDRGDFLRRDR
ncbi:hypothetical protein [Paracoccus sp. PAR01]|uniref:hypothetical protein n=1 Tax=Paracoccus sp. PAR01 TaxID=2769282 RepID=UPI00177F21AF|nr:hypothetical protein [Paracoccus sp. PAR01]MBD9526356.1 hypothetical protein [Paracoccus sp. PAR01]